MTESGQHPTEGGFGAPPGAAQWSPPAAQPAQHPQPAPPPQQYPPPTGQPYGVQPVPAHAPQQAPPQAYAPAYRPGYPAYQPSQGGQPGQPAYAGYVPAATARFPVGTFVLLVLSAISLIATGIIGIPSAIVAVIAWRRSATDPSSAKRLSTTGWIVYAANFAVGVPLLIWFYIWALSNQ